MMNGGVGNGRKINSLYGRTEERMVIAILCRLFGIRLIKIQLSIQVDFDKRF